MNLFGLGPMELGLILLVVLLLFGPKRLPQLGKSIGKTMRAIRDGVDGANDEATKEEEAPKAPEQVAAAKSEPVVKAEDAEVKPPATVE